MHFAKEGYSACFYDLSYALEMAQANGELKLWINVEMCDEEASAMLMNHAEGQERSKGKEKGKGKENGKGKKKGKGMKGSVTANHEGRIMDGKWLGFGSDEAEYLMAMRKYKAPRRY